VRLSISETVYAGLGGPTASEDHYFRDVPCGKGFERMISDVGLGQVVDVADSIRATSRATLPLPTMTAR
jgi:hypothetical protein